MTTVRQLIDREEKWARGVFARDKGGRICDPCDVAACCWCLAGGLKACYPGDEFSVAENAVKGACRRLYGTLNYMVWQDSRYATWRMVKRLLREAGV